MPTLTRDQVREFDRRAIEEYGVPGIVLMENAGRGVADFIERFGIARPVVICCGKGNNGGDGFVIARHLDLRGYSVHVAVWAKRDEIAGDAATNLHILERSGLPIEFFDHHDASRLEQLLDDVDWIVDALLGTGATGEPRPPLDAVIDQLNAHPGGIRMAVDIPSGLDCDTGHAAQHTFCTDHTCTFVAAKPGLLAPGADRYTGQIHVLDIGAPRRLVDEMLRGNTG